MNKAFQFLLAWYLVEREVPDTEARDIVLMIHQGIEAGETDSGILLDSLVAEAEKLARSEGNAVMLEMVDLGRRIDINAGALAKTETLISMRKIVDLPPGNLIADRVRQFRLKELASTLT